MSRVTNRFKKKELQSEEKSYGKKSEKKEKRDTGSQNLKMLLLIAITSVISTLPRGKCGEICQTDVCYETATRVLSWMNNTIDPCYDFFEFACRGWLTKNPIPRGLSSWEPQSIIKDEVMNNLRNILESPDKKGDRRPIKMARSMYRTCMDQASRENLGLKPLYDAFKLLGLPFAPPNEEEAENLDLPKIVGLAHRYYRIKMFSDTQIRRDVTDVTKNRLMLEQTPPFMKNFDEYLRSPEKFRNAVDGLNQFIREILKLAGAGKKTDDYTNDVLKFGTKVANTLATEEKRSSAGYHDYYLTINKLQEATDRSGKYWNWTDYLKSYFAESDIRLYPNNDVAVVIDMEYFKDLAELLRRTPRRILALYVYTVVYISLAPGTTERYRILDNVLNERAYGYSDNYINWYKCTNIANLYFDEAITAAYVQKHFNPQERQKAIEMWGDITNSFDDMLNELQWMDSRTKAQAHKKLHAMRHLIAFPEWITNPRKLEKYYRNIQVFEGRLLDTYVNYNLIRGRESLNNWRKSPESNKWVASGTTVNAFYTPLMNTATIPAGMLHTPLYSNGIDAINYGAIGAIMGHELTHGFDNRGRKYDDKGNMRQWWSTRSLKRYLEKVDCIIKQYSGYEVSQLGNNFRLDGVKTQGENIADNGGLEEAFRGYQKVKARNQLQKSLPGLEKFSGEQLFFLGFAQMWCGHERNYELRRWISDEVHPPNRYRVMGTLQNSPDFAKAYNCPRGSRMNPNRKCNLW